MCLIVSIEHCFLNAVHCLWLSQSFKSLFFSDPRILGREDVVQVTPLRLRTLKSFILWSFTSWECQWHHLLWWVDRVLFICRYNYATASWFNATSYCQNTVLASLLRPMTDRLLVLDPNICANCGFHVAENIVISLVFSLPAREIPKIKWEPIQFAVVPTRIICIESNKVNTWHVH